MPKYRSSLEESIAAELDGNKIKYTYESIRLPYTLSRTYKPDFILDNGICVESKGWHRGFGDALRKLRVVKEQHPEIDLRIVWSKLNMKATSCLNAEEWSIKYGFKYAEKLIPQSWIEE